MTASEAARPRAKLPRGVESVAAWEKQLDRTIESCRRIAWRRLTPETSARLLMALSLEIDDCGIESVARKMRTLSDLVHMKIDRWSALAEGQGTDDRWAT